MVGMSTHAPEFSPIDIPPGARFAIVAARFNAHLVDELLAGCVRRFEQLANFDQLLARAVALRTAGTTAEQIAARLNAEGFRPATRSAFNAPMIRRLLQRHGHGTKRPIWGGKVPRADAEEMTLQEVADQLGTHW